MAEQESYSKNLFTPKNIMIYLIIGGFIYVAVYYLFFANKGGYGPNDYQKTPPATSVTPSNEMRVTLTALTDEAIEGEAVLTEVGGQIKVTLTLSGSAAYGNHPAHIHTGACPTPGAVKYPLTNVGSEGVSETTLAVTLDQLRSELPLAINVHQSPEDIKTYLTCGDLQ